MFENLIGSISEGFSNLLPGDFCVPCFLKGLAEGVGFGALTLGALTLVATLAAPVAGAVALVAATAGVAGLTYWAAHGKPIADAADNAVLKKFGNMIPDAAKTPTAASVTVLQNNNTFQAELLARHPGIEKEININGIYGESYQKKIFVNKDKDYTGTLYHEAVHHYSNVKFQETFGSYNGVKVNEGVTEYFTREITTTGRRGHYDVETRVVDRAVSKLSEGGADGKAILQKAYFRGDPDSMKKLEEALK